MRLYNTIFLFFISLKPFVFFSQDYTTKLEDFPRPKEGFKIESIQFPVRDDEYYLRIEILIGYDSITDCNHYVLNGNIEEKELLNFKNSYFIVHSDFTIKKKKNKTCFLDPLDTFISMNPLFLNYNSYLPYIFILPSKMNIKYRIFKTFDFIPLNNYKIK